MRKGSEVHLAGEHNNEVVCKKCHPELHMLKCGICDDEKASSSFPTNERNEKGIFPALLALLRLLYMQREIFG